MEPSNKDPAFRFQCSKQWNELDKTGEDNVRFCRQCNEPVTLAKDSRELSNLAKQNRCAAIQRANDSGHKVGYPEEAVMTIGEPATVAYDLFSETQVPKHGALARLWQLIRKLFID